MIDLGVLNEYTKEKFELAQNLRSLGLSGDEISKTIAEAEKKSIENEE